MSDTRALLGKITALRQRLDQVQGLVSEAGRAAETLITAEPPAEPAAPLDERVESGNRQQALLDGALRRLSASLEQGPLPAALTARARRLAQQGRDLVRQLRTLGDDPLLTDPSLTPWVYPDAAPGDPTPADPLLATWKEAAAMLESGVRLVQTFPDTPSTQIRLAEGLESILDGVQNRIHSLTAALAQRHKTAGRVDTLADLLGNVAHGKPADARLFVRLAEMALADVSEAAPLRFLYVPPRASDPEGVPADESFAPNARFIACHSLTVAHLVARLARTDPHFAGDPLPAVVAALVHDIGMLLIDPAILAQAGPLDEAQRRAIEAHPRAGAELIAELLPDHADLYDAILSHHERPDGTGYPNGVREERLSPLAKLLAVADTYAALASPRPHREALDPRTALTETLLLAERGKLDRHAAERLLLLSFYPTGSVVELNDGTAALVVATHGERTDLQAPSRPVLAMLTDARGKLLPNPRHLDLAECEGRAVLRTLTAGQRRQLIGKRYPEWL